MPSTKGLADVVIRLVNERLIFTGNASRSAKFDLYRGRSVQGRGTGFDIYRWKFDTCRARYPGELAVKSTRHWIIP
jgi:hypothetical protein